MIVIGEERFVSVPFESEAELEGVVERFSEHIFGPDSVYLPKALIRSPEGHGTVPDGFVIDIRERRWFIVEAELAVHSVWSHIAPQVSKQIVAAGRSTTKQQLVDLFVSLVKRQPELEERFEDLGIAAIDIRREVAHILDTPPFIALPIDQIGADLRQWAQTLGTEVKLWLIRKLVDFDDPQRVMYEIPDEFRPELDTSVSASGSAERSTYDVCIADLIAADLVEVGQMLEMSYQPRGGDRRTYTAVVEPDGSLTVLGKTFSAPSYAALHGIQDAGSERRTVNGWIAWKDQNGRSIAELREELLSGNDSRL